MGMTKSTVKKQQRRRRKITLSEASMKPLTIIYWSRVLLGVVAALISVAPSLFSVDLGFFTSLAIAMLFYILTYYVYKPYFIAKVEKPTKIFTTGIGAYFFTWIVTWILFYTAWLWYTNQIPTLA